MSMRVGGCLSFGRIDFQSLPASEVYLEIWGTPKWASINPQTKS